MAEREKKHVFIQFFHLSRKIGTFITFLSNKNFSFSLSYCFYILLLLLYKYCVEYYAAEMPSDSQICFLYQLVMIYTIVFVQQCFIMFGHILLPSTLLLVHHCLACVVNTSLFKAGIICRCLILHLYTKFYRRHCMMTPSVSLYSVFLFQGICRDQDFQPVGKVWKFCMFSKFLQFRVFLEIGIWLESTLKSCCNRCTKKQVQFCFFPSEFFILGY